MGKWSKQIKRAKKELAKNKAIIENTYRGTPGKPKPFKRKKSDGR
jgi:hypothetical protein